MRIPIVLLLPLVAWGQFGSPYPYPGGGRGQQGPGLPIPRRGKQTKTPVDSKQPLPNFPGILKRIDAKSLVVVLDDFRELEFRRTDKTKFLKEGKDLAVAEFHVGDHVAVEASEDAEAFLTAVNVHWEKAGNGKAPGPPSENPSEQQIAAAEKAQAEAASGKTSPSDRAVEIKPPPAPPDADDPGPPKLQHGKPAPRKPSPIEREQPMETARAGAPGEVAVVEVPVSPSAVVIERLDEGLPGQSSDPLIRKAQETALQFTETLPNYVVQEMITRYQSETAKVSWTPVDVVSTEVVYENGKEDYRKISINGKLVKKGMEELSGSWSTGEFGTLLIDLFSPATAADFRFRRQARASGVDAKVYDYNVERENSHWTVRSGAQTFRPAYKGSVWIDPKTARVLRIEMLARNMPEEFPLDKVETATDYEYVRLGTMQQFLLPVHGETLSCQRGSSRCSRNAIDFRNYHKYSGESTIQFEDTKETKDTKPKK